MVTVVLYVATVLVLAHTVAFSAVAWWSVTNAELAVTDPEARAVRVASPPWFVRYVAWLDAVAGRVMKR